MTRIVITAKVRDIEKWEQNYRVHAPMLRELMGVTKPVQFSTDAETNEICLSAEPDDLDHYLETAQSPEIAEAMEKNGVIRETVKLYILDKQLGS
ncbi:hypothetical protein [Robiginitalea sp.]|uniref:hypothetical protein n=1 Tax=Robiginitalea sp. TaxID=1902411 RepID=UPI003C759070